MEINVSFNDRGAQELFAAFVEATGRSLLDACISGGRIAARSMGEKTWPKTYEEGANAVQTQIRRVYATLGDAYNAIRDKAGEPTADAFWAAIYGSKRKSWKTARAILAKDGGKMAGVPIQRFDGGTKHNLERCKNARGRIGKLKNPLMIVQNEGKNKTPLDRYIEKKQAMVGFTQGAWYDVLKQLGGSNRRTKRDGDFGAAEITTPFPKWVIRHGRKGTGEVRMSDEPDRAGVIIKSNVPWAQTALGGDNGGTERYIMLRTREHMLKFLRIAIAKAIESARKTA